MCLETPTHVKHYRSNQLTFYRPNPLRQQDGYANSRAIGACRNGGIIRTVWSAPMHAEKGVLVRAEWLASAHAVNGYHCEL